MPTVTLDLIDGMEGKQCWDRGGQRAWEFTRIAMVSGLTAFTRGNDLLGAAITALVGVVGDIGEGTYPNHTQAFIREFQPQAVDGETVKVTILYREAVYGAARIEVGSGVAQVESNLDRYGQKIELRYTYPADYSVNVARAGLTQKQGGTYMRLVPEASVSFRRTEFTSPLIKSTQYTGKINLTPFMGLPAKRWMCMGINGVSDDGGLTWDVCYSFQAREDTWDEKVFFINPDTGKPPEDLIEGTGMKNPERYTPIEFEDLQL